MSVDKLVDSTQLDSDLTSVADAIRVKSGGSGQLAFPSGFVSEIGNIPSGGGISIDWAEVTEVTIGANSITNMTGVQTFFSGYTYKLIILASPITVNNQFTYGHSQGSDGTLNFVSRYRNDAIKSSIVGNAYDAKLVEGTKYYLLAE